MPTFDNTSGQDETININIDIDAIVAELVKHPTFIKAIALHIRTAQTKDVRRMGNLYGSKADKPKPAPTTKRRLS